MRTRQCVFLRSISQRLYYLFRTFTLFQILSLLIRLVYNALHSPSEPAGGKDSFRLSPSFLITTVVLLLFSTNSYATGTAVQGERASPAAREETKDTLLEILALNDSVGAQPDNLELKRRFVAALLKGGYVITAMIQMEEILEKAPDDEALRLQLIDIAAAEGETEAAVRHANFLAKGPEAAAATEEKQAAGIKTPEETGSAKSSQQDTGTMIVSVIVNTEAKGEFFVNRKADGDFFVKTADLKSMGFIVIEGATSEIDGEKHVSLKSMSGIQFVFNENTLALEITAKPSLLPKKTLDFAPQRQPDVYYPKDTGAFMNYRFGYSAGNEFSFQSFDAVNQLGVRTGDLLFLTDSSYTKTPTNEQFLRLMSSITYDRRTDLQRLVAGDLVASSGNLGSSVTLGGLGFSKIYSIDPYFIKYPFANFTGFADLPSSLEVYLNGMRIRSEKLSPGEFQLSNLSYYGGASTVEVFIKDAFGRLREIRYPFYFTDTLLKKGLHEYSYNAGFLRNDLGLKSNEYSGLAFSGFHRYGISDSLTLGINSEGGKGSYNLGSQASLLLGNAGVASLALSGSRDADNKTGLGGILNYGYQGRTINAQLFVKGFTRDYATISNRLPGSSGLPADRTRYEAGVGMGYSTEALGSASVVFNRIRKYIGQDSQQLTVSYSKNLSKKTSLFASFTKRKDLVSSNDFFVGLTYYPGAETTLSASHERSNGMNAEILQIQRNPPVGEGYGYRASINRAEAPTGEITTINPMFQYNSRHGIYTAEYTKLSGGPGGTDRYNISASGGIAYVGNTLGFSRPINDSFGLVQVGNLEGVRVYQSNQEIGRTDAMGRVFVPNLGSYYDNQLSLNDKDIPMDYSIKEIRRYVSPPLRSGAVISFEVKKFQAITGMLKIKTGEGILPAEYFEVSMMVNNKVMTFPTGKGGEFYFENVEPGKYSASVDYKENKCVFDIIIPRTDEMISELGEIICENSR